MEVKPGYKQTEVGIIPDDWDVIPLSKLCRQICDGTHFTPKYVPEGVPFYSVENITANDFVNTKFITEAEHLRLVKRCKPERGDILMTRITAGVLGDTKILDWDVNASIYVSLALLKPNERVYPNYLYRYSKSQAFIRDVEKRALVNATPKKINMQDIGAIPIPAPRLLSEQRAIAEALSDADALIEALEQFIAKKRQIKQGAIQELLTGKRRLPGFSEKWEDRAIAQIAPLQRGFDLPSSKLRGGIYPVVYSNGIMNYHESFMVHGPGVVTGRSGTLGKIHYVEEDYWPHNTSLWVTRFNGNSPKFIYYLYTFIGFERFASGSGVPTLNRNDAHEFRVYFPPSSAEQTAIAEILSDMDAEITALEGKLSKAQQVKQGMMQLLLTGRIRLV